MKGDAWWREGVIYQIYPRSFCDSNNDGIGDIPGIISRLDYLSDLGIDGIWLSPINTSPMFDFGYDISDYRGIDPVFGTLADFDELLKEAHRRKIRIILDLVMNHSSHLHPWFIESRSSRDNPKRDWYIWRDGKGRRPPNNWMAAFGGRAWEWDEKTRQYYLHSFLKEQPDFNWRNEKCREALFGEIRYWLDRGVDGFRLDVVNYFVKDDRFRSNPLGIGQYPRPYELQKHIYDRDRPEMHDILREFRSLLDSYEERMSVGEIGTEYPGNPALSASYLGNGDDELHLAFDFSLVFMKWSARGFFKCINDYMSAVPAKGWPCHVLSNHDVPRGISRYAGSKDPEVAKRRAMVAAVLLLTLRGTPFLYYGEELGMKEGRLKRKQIVDPVGRRYWPFHKGRDGARTPMQWSASENAGFGSGSPWLPVNPDYREVNVERESRDPSSLLNLHKKLIALRKGSRALRGGSWVPAVGGLDDVIAYFREAGRERLFVALNFGEKSRPVEIDGGGNFKVLFSTHRKTGEAQKGLRFNLAPNEATVFQIIG